MAHRSKPQETPPGGLFPSRLCLLVFLLGVTSADAQTWVTTTNDYVQDEVRHVIQTSDGRFLAVASTGRALALLKRNSDGSLLWQRLLMGLPTGEGGSDVLELPDGRIVAAGDIHVNAHGNDDMALAILSPDARSVSWQRAYGGPEGDDRALDLVRTRDGGYLLVGETLSWATPGRNMLAVRVDAGGGLLWASVFGSATEPVDDVLYSAVELPSGEYLAAGSSGSVLQLGANGALVGSRRYGLEIREIVPTGDGGFALVGWRTVGANDVAELIKLDASGAILWRASYGQAGVTYRLFAAAPLADGGYLAGGEINVPINDFDGWLVRLDSNGDIVWQRQLNDGGGEVHAVAPAEGGFLAGGHRGFFPEMMVARVDSTGNVPSCGHPATQAVRTPSGGGWIAETRPTIAPTTLVVTETDKPVTDSSSPQDLLTCADGPTLRPSEVSPPAASDHPLRFQSGESLVWEDAEPSASTSFDLYRGDLAGLGAGAPPQCLMSGLAASSGTDVDIPPSGAGFYYVVAGRNGVGGGTLGHDSAGVERVPAVPCE